MDNSLVPAYATSKARRVAWVLILVVMDNSLVQMTAESLKKQLTS